MEMVVVLGIMVAITTIALVGQSSFSRSIVLTDTAYTIAFSIREAQALGISSRVFGNTQNAGYGVHFSAASPTSYALFADTFPGRTNNIQPAALCPGHAVGTGPEARPGDCKQTEVSEIVRTYSFNNGYRISGFCGIQSGGTERCNGYLTALDITYLRPSTLSVISGIRENGAIVPLESATIQVTTAQGTASRCILVSKVGQVSVVGSGEATCP